MTGTSADVAAAHTARRRLWLRGEGPLSAQLVTSLEEVLAYGAAMAGRVQDEPEVAVHEVRKTLRRARSLMRLLRPAVSATARHRIGTTLKQVHRAVSPLRDNDVLLGLLDRRDLQRAGAETTAALRVSLQEQRQRLLGTLRAAQVLAAGLVELGPLPGALARALAESVEWPHLVRGFRDSYRRARRELQRTLAIHDPVHVHNWRKRSKDLDYQLELLASVGGREVKRLRKPYTALAARIGEATDLLLLRDALRASVELAAQSDFRRVEKRVNKLIERRLRSALKDGRPLFSTPPKKLARLLDALLGRTLRLRLG